MDFPKVMDWWADRNRSKAVFGNTAIFDDQQCGPDIPEKVKRVLAKRRLRRFTRAAGRGVGRVWWSFPVAEERPSWASLGSRQQEAQRLWRILRPKDHGNQAHCYTLVSHQTCEQEFALRRQLFLCEHGYSYEILHLEDGDALDFQDLRGAQ